MKLVIYLEWEPKGTWSCKAIKRKGHELHGKGKRAGNQAEEK